MLNYQCLSVTLSNRLHVTWTVDMATWTTLPPTLLLLPYVVLLPHITNTNIIIHSYTVVKCDVGVGLWIFILIFHR